MQLTDNVYVETEYQGANVGHVTTDQGIVMIESPQRPTDAIAWRTQTEGKGKLKYLIHTEGHGDHIAGSFFFDVPVVAHEKTRDAIVNADKKRILDMIAMMDPEGSSLIDDYEFNIPVITFSECLTLYLGSHTFHLINMPGHTVGQTAVFIPEEKVVFTGDNVNYQAPAFMHECVPLNWLKSIDKLKQLDVDHIVPGHGGVCDKSYLGEWREFIQEWIDAVRQAISRGWSKEEAIEKMTLPSRYPMPPGNEEMTKMFRTMNISRLYDQLGEKES